MVLFFLSSTIGYAQNLILNNSFEDATVVQGQYWFEELKYWWQLGSCDVYSENYLEDGGWPNCNLCIPLNRWGYQWAQHGRNYVGLGITSFSPPPTPPNNIYYGSREYLGGYFSETLKANTKYSFSFYASVAEYSNAYGKSLQIKTFSDSTCSTEVECRQEGNLIWEMDTVITEKSEWHKINFAFTAIGNEKAFLLSYFTPNDSLDFQDIPGTDTCTNPSIPNYHCYNTLWFVDNFSLTEILDPVPFEDNLSITNNPGYGNATTQFKATLNTASTADLFVYDEAGRIIAHHVFTESQEIFSLPQLAGAVYYYTFDSDTHVRLEGKIVQY